ncbi:MAG: glycosyltransferase family 2 protein, partial [Pseudomonadota bacterium]|nr:glycosyltransferase family 2 protein [Pseudomonadota bacterium]
MPKVSVLIPMYNAQDTIERAVLSANQLDLGGVEVIIVDDASRDQSLQVVDELNLECVRIISAGSNRGPSFCRNVGLELAVGEWIAVLDSDDWFSKGRLSKLIGIAETNGLDLIADDQWLWGGSPIRPMRRRSETLSILRQTDKPYNVNIKTLLENVGLGITQPIFRRSFLEKHNIRYR